MVVLDSRGSSHGHASKAAPPRTIEHGAQAVTGPTAGTTPRSSTPAATTRGIQPGGWAHDVAGYTVALASDRTEADARLAAEHAVARGLPSVGLVWSSEYRSLRPGYWFVFSGIYSSAAAAAGHVAAATAAGFAGAYPRRVAR